MANLELWFLRDRDVVRCYAYEGEEIRSSRLRKMAPDERYLTSGVVFCEILDEGREVIGFTGMVDSQISSARAFFHGACNAKLIEDGGYLIALGATADDLAMVEQRYRVQTDDAICPTCGCDGGRELNNGEFMLDVLGWWVWMDRGLRILRVDVANGPVFSRPVELLSDLVQAECPSRSGGGTQP